jgi:2-polyprenyl-6-methoxyphenol hydroxylase-like FAD-dependent oxidoreductase
MNAGIQDALCLANKLADVLAGDAHESTLSSYEEERRPVAEAVVGVTRHLSGIANMRGEIGPKIRNRALRLIGRLPAFRTVFAARLAGFAGAKLPPRPDEGKRLYVAALVFVALLGIMLLASTRH